MFSFLEIFRMHGFSTECQWLCIMEVREQPQQAFYLESQRSLFPSLEM
jgi:hypothetical protein